MNKMSLKQDPKYLNCTDTIHSLDFKEATFQKKYFHIMGKTKQVFEVPKRYLPIKKQYFPTSCLFSNKNDPPLVFS